jgi:plastocyanin
MRIRVLLAVGVLAADGCSGSEDKAAGEPGTSAGPTVSLKLLAFQPGTLTVKAGTSVTWRNDEPITHTVTSGAVTGVDPSTGLRSGEEPDGTFDEKLASKGATSTYRFSQPGTYSYFCSIHKGMNATVEVTA